MKEQACVPMTLHLQILRLKFISFSCGTKYSSLDFFQPFKNVKTTFLGLSRAKSKISFGKCHIALENMWVIFKHLLILISNIITQS